MIRDRRWLHPVAWWLWALLLAATASRTTNPLTLLLIVSTCAFVVSARRPIAPWARSFRFFLSLAAIVVVTRILIGVLLGAPQGDVVLFTLPAVPLPDWAAGIQLGGDVTLGALLFATYDALRLATILICVGSASTLAAPTRLLKCLPAAVYEAGLSVVITLTLVPQLVEDATRIAQARRLRGRSDRGIRAYATSALPVLESGLDRSIALAAAMDSRGYGRTQATTTGSHRARHLTTVLLLGGLLCAAMATYALLDASTPAWMGLPLLAVGVITAGAGVLAAGRRSVRSRYRPDPWRHPEWLVALAAVPGFAVIVTSSAAVVDPSVDPAVLPSITLALVTAIAVALTPAWTAPDLPFSFDPRARRTPVGSSSQARNNEPTLVGGAL